MFKTLNPFSAFNRKQMRDLEAELRGRGHVHEADHRSSTTLKALNPFSAFNRKQIRDLEADLRGRGRGDVDLDETAPSAAPGGPTVPPDSASHESKAQPRPQKRSAHR